MHKDFAIPSFDTLLCLEDPEISAHIQSAAHQLQRELVLWVVIPYIGVTSC